MQDLEQILRSCYSKDLEQRKHWYGSVADDYNKVRPRYHQNLIDRVIELAQLSSNATILEVGCGPGNATISFARLGFSICCLEPNPEFCQLVRHNCKEYPRVKQEEILKGFGQHILDSGLFGDLISENIACQIAYSTDDYLKLLNTFSQYRAIAPHTKKALFEGLRDKIESNLGGRSELSYLSAFHLARKL
jgi:SAM-dependent methyltransferase